MKVVIIGAGQTGRGFIAPIFYKNNYDITFIDKNENLIEVLNDRGSYTVKYFQNLTPKMEIDNYKAFHINDKNVIEEISDADIVTTSVFANQINTLIPLLKKSISKRTKNSVLVIICVENGVNVKKPLSDERLNAYISEGVIFCTSIKDEQSLDITSEANIELPVDKSPILNNLNISGILFVDTFNEIIQRKIYTYNFISAIIAYLGDYKGYSSYSEAANDIDIINVLNSVLPSLNRIIAKKFKISVKEQKCFSQKAIDKFSNREIKDSIVRNAQQVERKLKSNERLIIPLKLAIENNEKSDAYCMVIASAIYYGVIHENIILDNTIESLNKELRDSEIKRIKKYYNFFENKVNLSEFT